MSANLICKITSLLLVIFCLYDFFIGINFPPLFALLIWVFLSSVLVVFSSYPPSKIVSVIVIPLSIYAAFVSYGLASSLIPIYELIPKGSYLAIGNIIFTSILIAAVTSIAISPLLSIVAKSTLMYGAFSCVLVNYLFTIQDGFPEKILSNVIIALEQLFVFVAIYLTAVFIKKSAITRLKTNMPAELARTPHSARRPF